MNEIKVKQICCLIFSFLFFFFCDMINDDVVVKTKYYVFSSITSHIAIIHLCILLHFILFLCTKTKIHIIFISFFVWYFNREMRSLLVIIILIISDAICMYTCTSSAAISSNSTNTKNNKFGF